MTSLSALIDAQHPFDRNIDRRARVLRGLSVLLGLLVVGGGCEAGQASTSGSPAGTSAYAAPAAVRQEKSDMWMTVGERRFAITLPFDARPSRVGQTMRSSGHKTVGS
jgi:hypothetical protein